MPIDPSITQAHALATLLSEARTALGGDTVHRPDLCQRIDSMLQAFEARDWVQAQAAPMDASSGATSNTSSGALGDLPIQPIFEDEDGRLRFRANPIVAVLQRNAACAGMDLNEIANMSFENRDMAHFAQLIGYDLEDYCALSYVTEAQASSALQASKAIQASSGSKVTSTPGTSQPKSRLAS